MKRTLYLYGLALLISLIAFLGFVGTVKASSPNMDEDEEWGQYTYACVRGFWTRIGLEYWKVEHEAGIFECLKGSCRFKGWDKAGNLLYNKFYWLGPQMRAPMFIEYNPPYYWVIWRATTETTMWVEQSIALIGPPGAR